MTNFIIEYKYAASQIILELNKFDNAGWKERMQKSTDYKLFVFRVNKSKFLKSIKRIFSLKF